MMEFIIWILILSSLYVTAGLGVLFLAGLVWAPVAGLISGVSAAVSSRNGGIALRNAVKGGFYSMLFVFPWIYLIFRTYGKTAPTALVRLGYVVIYISWLFGPIALSFVLFYVFSVSSNNPFLDDSEERVTQITVLVGSAISLLANVIFWMKSLRDIRQAHINDKSHSRSYIMPFVYPAVLMILSFLIFTILDWGLRYIVR